MSMNMQFLKRTICLLLAAVLMLGMVPPPHAHAAEAAEDPAQTPAAAASNDTFTIIGHCDDGNGWGGTLLRST